MQAVDAASADGQPALSLSLGCISELVADAEPRQNPDEKAANLRALM